MRLRMATVIQASARLCTPPGTAGVRETMDMVALFRQLTLGVYIVGLAQHARRDVSVLEQTQMQRARRLGTSAPETADKMNSGVCARAAGAPLAYADTRNLDHSAELYPASF